MAELELELASCEKQTDCRLYAVRMYADWTKIEGVDWMRIEHGVRIRVRLAKTEDGNEDGDRQNAREC